MAKPIRRDVLIHTITYQQPIERDTWGQVGFASPQTVERVRVEPVKTTEITADGVQAVSPSLIFVDAVHSTAAEWVLGGIVTFDGADMHIKAVKPFYDRAGLHHIELTVI